jgi:flavin reductase (DIM6/NTAB) family NADH-FMN oxidoreductase RutF
MPGVAAVGRRIVLPHRRGRRGSRRARRPGGGVSRRAYDRGVSVAAEELRELMRRVPAGVAVVTVDADGQRIGLTVASLTSLSLDPPLAGVSISRFAALHELLREAGGFAASLLAAGQEAVAQHFARGVPPIALWEGVEVREGRRGPLLEGALGWLECETLAEHPAGDHTLFAGLVESVTPGPGERPLVYVEGRYAAW